jgi:hypothetical protein
MPLKPDERRRRELGESLLAAVRDLALSFRSLRDEKERRIPQAQVPTTKDHIPDAIGILRDITNRLDAFVGEQKRENQKTTTFQKKYLHIQWLLFWATAAAFVAAAVYAGIAKLQKDVMNDTLTEVRKQSGYAEVSSGAAQEALKLARENFRQDERPYIALSELPPGTPNSGKVGIHEGRVRVLLPIQNYGRSPAIDTASFGKVAIGNDQIQRINFDLPTSQDIGIVPPGLFPPISAFSEPVSSPDDMKQPMVIYGRIDYTDIFASPKPRYSLFFCQAANVEVTVVPSYAMQACKGKNYTK